MADDAAIVVGIKGDLSGGVAVKTNLDQIKQSGDAVTKNQKDLQEQLQKTSSVAKELVSTMLQVAAAYLSVHEAVEQFNKAITAGVELQALNNKMNAATGNAQVAAEAFSFLRETSEQLGLEFRTSADAFAGFAASGLRAGITFGDLKTIFKDVATAATSMQLPAEQVHGIFVALDQMASKGSVQMQELRLQLGNNLPGAFEIFAKSMGVSTAEFNKMISSGQVGVDKLKGFAEELKNELGGSAVTASQQFTAESNRLKNAVFDLRTEFANHGPLQGYTDLIKSLADLFKDPRFVQSIDNLAGAIGRLLDDIAYGIKILPDFIDDMTKLSFRMVGMELPPGIANAGGTHLPPHALDNPATTAAKNQSMMQRTINSGGDFYSMMGINNPANDAYTLGSPSSAPDKAGEEAAKKIKRVTDEIKLQTDNLQRNKAEQEVYNNLKKAGVTIDSAAGQNIAELTRQYEANSEALKTQKEWISGVADSTKGFFKDWITGAEGFKGAIKSMIGKLADLAFQMEVIKPIEKNLFGGSSGGSGILGALFGSLGGSKSSAPVDDGIPDSFFVPGFATGGSMLIGGNSGVDKNLLSLNGAPIAKVGKGETLSVVPSGGGSSGGGIVVNQTINISTGVAQTVAAEVQAMLPKIQASTIAALNEQNRRSIQS